MEEQVFTHAEKPADDWQRFLIGAGLPRHVELELLFGLSEQQAKDLAMVEAHEVAAAEKRNREQHARFMATDSETWKKILKQ